MKNTKKKILIFFSSCAFVALMLFNVSVSMENTGMSTDISLSGISALAVSGSECDGVSCAFDGWGARCFYTGTMGVTCNDSNYPDCTQDHC